MASTVYNNGDKIWYIGNIPNNFKTTVDLEAIYLKLDLNFMSFKTQLELESPGSKSSNITNFRIKITNM